MKLPVQYGVAGYFSAYIKSEDGNVRCVQDNVKNLITNTGMDRLGTTTPFASVMVVGSGSTAPAVTNTALVAQVGAAATANLSGTLTANVAARTVTATYNTTYTTGAVAGNLTEIGIGSSSTALSTRALFLDGDGNPTTITVGATDQLIVVYNIVFTLPDLVTQTVVETESGTSYTITHGTASPFGASSASLGLGITPLVPFAQGSGGTARSGAVTFGAALVTPSGGSAVGTFNSVDQTITYSSYVNGSFTINVTWLISLTAIVGTGINTLTSYLSSAIPWKFSFSPAFNKTASQTLSITLALTWVRT